MAVARRGDVELHYDVKGESGDPVLFIMGLAGDSYFWSFQVPDFAKKHRTIVYDNRGVGRSSKPAGPYSTAEMADDAVAILDHAGIERAHVIGISMGGMIAQHLALKHPHRVASLSLCATYARPGKHINSITEKAAAMMGGEFDPKKMDFKTVLDFLTPLVVSPAFLERQRAWFDGWVKHITGLFSIEGLFAQVAAAMMHDTVQALPTLEKPTLIFTGTQDVFIPHHHSDKLAQLIPGAQLVKMEGAPHGFNVERHEEFNRVLLDFVARYPLESAANAA